MFNIRGNNGFGIIEVVVAAGILGIVALAFTNFMGSVRTSFNAQVDLEARVELFQTLNFMQRFVDCQTTISGIPSGTTIPASGMPIELKGSGAGSATYLSEYGGKKGRFSFLADIFPDNSIMIRAAAFKTDGGLPRTRLAASDSEFLAKKSSSEVWSWDYTTKLIEKNFSSLASICGGNVATAGSSGDVSLQCSTALTAQGGTTALGMPLTYCTAVNSKTTATCGPVLINSSHPDYSNFQTNIDNCMLKVKGCPDGQTLQNPASSCVGMYCADMIPSKYKFTCGPIPKTPTKR